MTDDQIREIWLAVTGVDEPAVAWDVIGFARAIEQASRRAALEEAIRVTTQAKTTSHACDAIRALSSP
jgi:hypothetical protein